MFISAHLARDKAPDFSYFALGLEPFPRGKASQEMIGVRRALLFLGLLFWFSSRAPSVTPTDVRLTKLRLEGDRASPRPSENK